MLASGDLPHGRTKHSLRRLRPSEILKRIPRPTCRVCAWLESGSLGAIGRRDSQPATVGGVSVGVGWVVGVDVSGGVGDGVSVGTGVKLGVAVKGTKGVGVGEAVVEGVAVFEGVRGCVGVAEDGTDGVGEAVGVGVPRSTGLERTCISPAQ